jgi:hypothetical protein
MTECYSARCQQDRKLARREFNKWTKNLLFQIGLETISKNHFEFDVNLFNQTDGLKLDRRKEIKKKPILLFYLR